MLYRAIVRSKLDYGCIVYGTASITNLRQWDIIDNSGLRLAFGAFCTSPVSSLYTEANEAPLEERWLKLSMHYYVKTSTCPMVYVNVEYCPLFFSMYTWMSYCKGFRNKTLGVILVPYSWGHYVMPTTWLPYVQHDVGYKNDQRLSRVCLWTWCSV